MIPFDGSGANAYELYDDEALRNITSWKEDILTGFDLTDLTLIFMLQWIRHRIKDGKAKIYRGLTANDGTGDNPRVRQNK